MVSPEVTHESLLMLVFYPKRLSKIYILWSWKLSKVSLCGSTLPSKTLIAKMDEGMVQHRMGVGS
jgi:hypothetical protein